MNRPFAPDFYKALTDGLIAAPKACYSYIEAWEDFFGLFCAGGEL